jgi:predicted short-subunit dehydrogenase-like oxidoreductase (DUF2520 family)
MTTRTRHQVAVIGLGNWGTSLAAALARAGLLAARIHVARQIHASRPANTRRNSISGLDAPILWLCVPDAAIASTAAWLTQQRPDLTGQIVLHSSGALDRSVLDLAARAGARTGSIHPMMSFPSRRIVALAGTSFAVETSSDHNDAAMTRTLFALVRRLGGRPFAIPTAGKALYHAGAMFGSPLLVASLAAGVRSLRAAGIEHKMALDLLGPIAAATVANVQQRGLDRSFSGPIARGDAATLKLHRQALVEHPLVTQVYQALARLAAEDLPSANRPAVKAALETTIENDKQRRTARRNRADGTR